MEKVIETDYRKLVLLMFLLLLTSVSKAVEKTPQAYNEGSAGCDMSNPETGHFTNSKLWKVILLDLPVDAVSTDNITCYANTTVTLTFNNYDTKKVTVLSKRTGESVSVTKDGDNTCTFRMPASDVVVTRSDYTPFVVLCKGSKTLYFARGIVPKKGEQFNGETVSKVWSGSSAFNIETYELPDWGMYYDDYIEDYVSDTRKVVFDKSFQAFFPKYVNNWFYHYRYMYEIVGLEYLNGAKVKEAFRMFEGCEQLQHVDLSSFETPHLTNIERMFYRCYSLETLDIRSLNTENVTLSQRFFVADCGNLTTIIAGDGWTNKNFDTWTTSGGYSTYGDRLFWNCYNLTGGKGTIYKDKGDCVDMQLARIDREEEPGYLTSVEDWAAIKLTVSYPSEPYALYSAKDNTLTFCNDDKKHSYKDQEGIVIYSMPEAGKVPEWRPIASLVRNVVFASSFVGYRPQTLDGWFYNFTNLTGVQGIRYIDAADVTSTALMFLNCGKLTDID